MERLIYSNKIKPMQTMTKKFLFLKSIFIIILFITACNPEKEIKFSTDTFTLALNQKGNIVKMQDVQSGKDYLAKEQIAPFLSIRVKGEILAPSSMDYGNSELIFHYDSVQVRVQVNVEQKESHLSFEVMDVQPKDKVELIIWGPYPTIINKSIGETVGVVRGEEFAMGLQALNPKTLGGYPWNENDCMPQLDIFENDDLSDLNEEGKRYVLYRVEAAKPEDFGSTLQAYCRNRNHDRIIENWSHEEYLAPAYNDGGVIGSKIALFGCPVEQCLDFIGKIEIAEDLPHPFIDGEWGKTSRTANASYLIMGFGEEDIEKAIEYTKKAGLKYLDHPGPFKTWGHFELNNQFPNGYAGMKNCVDLAESQGIHLGAHTLSNFITTNDPYVSPVPDKRLAKVGFSQISSSIDDAEKEIPIESPLVFQQLKNNNLKTVVIDDELIRYGSVSKEKPWKLIDCQRGAFETKPVKHKSGTDIALLADHAYKVFLTNPDLTKEVAINIAKLFNETGLRQISFDGLEGNRSTGMGNYGEILMTTTWYDNLNENIKSHFIADASRTSHYFWHIYTRMNWGEPWYAGFRESQTEYRFKNQKYFERNLMPGMLGWFLMTGETSLEDIEWLLAKAAGYNAGFGFVSNYKSFEENGQTEVILEQIKVWEEARLQGVFDMKTREKLKDKSKEFHLVKTDDEEWELSEIKIFKGEHSKKERQPGEPLFSKISFSSSSAGQSMGFVLSAKNGDVKDIVLEIDNYKKIEFPNELRKGESIKYSGENSAIYFDKNQQKIKEFPIDPTTLSPGKHSINLDCGFTGGKETKLKLEIRITGDPVDIRSSPEM
jgi:hypothetical protein